MPLVPYTGHGTPRRLVYPKNPTPLTDLVYRLQVAVLDDRGLLKQAAAMLVKTARERDAADARVKGLEAEVIMLRALAKGRTPNREKSIV